MQRQPVDASATTRGRRRPYGAIGWVVALLAGARLLIPDVAGGAAVDPEDAVIQRFDAHPSGHHPSHHSSGHHLHAHQMGAYLEVRLTPDGPSVAEMVETVRRHAEQTPGAHADAHVELVLVADLPRQIQHDGSMLAGAQVGSTALVRTDLAWPERTLVHEVAHVLTAGDEHGAIWRAVYLGAIDDLFGELRRAQEERRVAWVYDHCYRTDTCPVRTDRDG